MVTKFYLVRHGETHWNKIHRIQGWTNNPLNAKGKREAHNIARELKTHKFDTLYSSSLLRAMQTADIIAHHLQLTVIKEDAFKERRYGIFEGMFWNDIDMHAYHHYHHFQPPNGESQKQLFDRVISKLNELAAVHINQTVLIVSHGGVIRTIAMHLGVIDKKDNTFFVHNAGYISFEYIHARKRFKPVHIPMV